VAVGVFTFDAPSLELQNIDSTAQAAAPESHHHRHRLSDAEELLSTEHATLIIPCSIASNVSCTVEVLTRRILSRHPPRRAVPVLEGSQCFQVLSHDLHYARSKSCQCTDGASKSVSSAWPTVKLEQSCCLYCFIPTSPASLTRVPVRSS
jgi:hypothetical protein